MQWERYLACSSLPDPRKEAEVNEYIAEVGEYSDEGTDLESALQKCREIEKVSKWDTGGLLLKMSLPFSFLDS